MVDCHHRSALASRHRNHKPHWQPESAEEDRNKQVKNVIDPLAVDNNC
jgi:hypothetical protein